MLAEPVFVGREEELAQLEHYLKLATEGKGTTVFVSGEAGSGKTRLTREFLNTAKKQGIGVMAGWCLSDAVVPYFPFVEAFNSYFASFDEDQPASFQQSEIPLDSEGTTKIGGVEGGIISWLTRSKPVEKPGKPEALRPQAWKDQIFVAFAQTLHSISVQVPIVLFIEDIHWADSASLALLHYVARFVNNSEKILVLATFRSEELTADAEGHPHPLAETMRLMGCEDLFTEIKLSNLDLASVSKIAENMVGGSLQPKLAEKLAVESRGNPLFVVESLRMLHERGSLVREDNQWRLVIDELGIPSKIRDIILRRLAVLKYAQRRVLDAASVVGEKFDVELLSTVLGLDSLEVLETLNVIAHSTSLVSVEENFYRFDHARSRETLYEELSLPLKRGYHARIAEKLEGVKGEELPLSDLAYHYAQSGNKEKAIKYAIEAGKDALAKFSSSQAISHFTYVLQALGEESQHGEQREVALEGLGDAFYAKNMFEEAVKTFESLANTNVGAVKRRALTKAMYAAFFQGDYPRIEELVRRAEEYGDLDQLERARVLHFKGVAASGLHKGTTKAWLRLYEEALRIFEEEYALSDAAWLLFVLADITAYVTSSIGEMEKPLAMCLRSIAIYDELRDFRSQMEAYNQAGSVFSAFALYPEALGMHEKVFEIEQKTKMGNYIMLAKASAFSAQLADLTGDFAGAVMKGLKALEYSEKSGSYLFLGIIYSYLVINYVKLGNMPLAGEYFAKLMNLPQRALMGIYTMFIDLAKAVYFAGKNQWEQSTKQFNGLMAFYKTESWNIATRIPVLANYAWALEKQGKRAEAKKMLQSIDKVVEECAEKVKHANVQANLMVPINVKLGQTFNARLDMVNVSRARCSITNVQNLFLTEFKVTAYPMVCTIHDDILELSNNTLEPFTVKTVTLSLQATKAGAFNLNPQVTYLDNLGQTKTCNPSPITVTVKPPAKKLRVAGRISSGTPELDRLLLGGIPENYTVVLAASSSEERSQVIKHFLETGAETGETTFSITAETRNAQALAGEQPSNFYLFLCNPRADAIVQNLPNVSKLKGVENLTEIDIALTKAVRTLNPTETGPKRACIEIISDVLLQHHAVTTRKWLTALLPDLKSKGFTILAVIDPQMHPSEETQAILGLFDGEISIYEKETPKGSARFLKVKRLSNQKYLKDEIRLTEE